MRKTQLLTATALSLILGAAAFSAGQAVAATTISTGTTAPVKTSVTGDLTVDTAGSITLTSGTAVTVDSDNKVTLNGVINMASSADNSTGILITDVPGRTASGLTVAANITVTDSYTASDTVNSDGIPDGPYAQGTGRYGIHSVGTSPFKGDVALSSGTIDVEGNNSYGVRFENNIDGSFTNHAAVVMEGDNNVGIALDNGATGRVYLSGSSSVHGQNGEAASLKGNFADAIIIDGSYTASGYSTTSISDAATLVKVLATPSDIYQGGPAVDIGGNVAKGIIINAVPTNDSTNTSVDQDGDGNVDSGQLTAAISSYGSAPGLRIGSASQDITVGPQVFSSAVVSPPAVAYGLDIRGAVTGSGIYQNVNSNAIQLGGMGHLVSIANGIRVKGVVQSIAYGGTATTLIVGAGTTTPLLDVSGTLNATADSATTATTINSTTTYSTVTAGTMALDIASNAHLPTINVSSGGGIYAASTGSTTTATAIRDQSGNLTAINNNGIISAAITASDDNGDGKTEAVTNRGIAIDARTNTVGLAITQTDTALTDDTIAAPYIQGDILLGSGGDAISSSGGSITGNIDFGGGANSFTLTNGASFLGKMTDAGGTVNFDIAKGSVGLLPGSTLNLTNFHVGSESTLALALDTSHPATSSFAATGTAVFDNDAKLQLTLNNLVTTATTFSVLTAAGGINLGNMTTADLAGNAPYIYHADLSLNSAHTELDANFRLKTQAEAGYSNNEYAALVPVLTAVSNDASGTSALLSQTAKSGFDALYEQYLPDYSGEDLIDLSLGAQSLNRSLSSLTLIPDNTGGQYWLQEYGYHTTRDYGDTAGFKSTGFSFAGGRERKMNDLNMLGVYMSYTSASPLDTFAISKEDNVNSDLTVGGYWRVRDGAFKAWAHLGAGFANFKTTREVLNASVMHIAYAKWNGFSYSGGAGASVDYKAGWLGVTPQVFADFYGLNEQGHSETSATTDTTAANAFDLTIGKRDGHVLSSTAMVNFNYTKSFVKPEFWLGYKQNISGSLPNTIANFKGGTPFTLVGGDIKGGGPVAGFRLSADNQWSYFAVEGDYEKQDTYTNYSLSLRTRFQF